DAMGLPADISRTIAQTLKIASNLPATRQYLSPEAHEAYLRGRYLWFASNTFTFSSMETARTYFEKAIQLQPDYAAAWSGLADTYAYQAVALQGPPAQFMEKVEAPARKALELDASNPEAHNSLAAFYLFGKWDLNKADKES